MFDVAIVGSGPAGAACAAFCVDAGLRTLLLEREKFPREKVCGDCLNPSCWPVLERLRVLDAVRQLPHGKLDRVDFIAIGGRTVSVELPPGAEIAVKRSLFDEVLMNRARAGGAEVREAATVTALALEDGQWNITAGGESFAARALVAADGRNSTVARLLGLLPRIERDRVGLQTHLRLPVNFGSRVVLQFLPAGYSGQAPVGNGELNLCLVGKPSAMPALRRWAEVEFGIRPGHTWRTITPLRRAAVAPAERRAFLIGDAARVVEPFTGEGIYYALRSGELAASAAVALVQSGDEKAAASSYTAAHEQLYRGRLWVNRVARAAVLSPRLSSALLRAGVLHPRLLYLLTTKVVAR
ncbi:MAG: NAD(P)/FAD-dependent oxidoreductase [Chthoniobacterales bacterium]|nr:NAD(P)/FAD-dependent oxidoreductase [Chthoniobacterales bacterium]